jgi:hypothetical protein
VKYVLIGLLKAYRLVVSPLYGNVCRYYPSCSAYALRAVQVHGAVRGSWLAGRRLLRCHPWTPGGYDPVPGTPEWQEEQTLLAAGPVTDDRRTRPDHPAHDHTAHADHDHSPLDPQRRDRRRDLPTDSPVLQRVP